MLRWGWAPFFQNLVSVVIAGFVGVLCRTSYLCVRNCVQDSHNVKVSQLTVLLSNTWFICDWSQAFDALQSSLTERCERLNIDVERVAFEQEFYAKVFETLPWIKMKIFYGTLMQIWKSPYMFLFISKYYPENFRILNPKILELFTSNVCETFVYKHTETIKYVKK